MVVAAASAATRDATLPEHHLGETGESVTYAIGSRWDNAVTYWRF